MQEERQKEKEKCNRYLFVEQYMMDPLSLNDFPAIVRKVNEKELVKIEIRAQ